MQDENTDNSHLFMQKEGKTRSYRSKGKDKDGLTAVPLTGDQKQTRSKWINLGKDAEIPARSRKGKK